MVWKNNGFVVKSVQSWIYLLLLVIIFVLAPNHAVANDNGVKQKGRDIIRDKQSTLPEDVRAEFDEMNERLNQECITEEEATEIFARGIEISNELKKLYNKQHNKEKQKKLKVKRDLIKAIIVNEAIDSDVIPQLSDIPIIGVGTDYEYDAIAFTIRADMFNEENIKEYIRKIRKIVGDEVDIVLSPGNIPVLQ